MDIFQLLGFQFSLINFLIPLAILVLFLLLIRELLTWYWKLNKIVGLLEKIEENTRKTAVVGELNAEIKPIETQTDALGFKIK